MPTYQSLFEVDGRHIKTYILEALLLNWGL